MRLKTFLVTYLLFVVTIFTSLGIVSVYMTQSQYAMLREKSTAEFKTIASSLTQDIALLKGRNLEPGILEKSVEELTDGYVRYYQQSKITLRLQHLTQAEAHAEAYAKAHVNLELSFLSEGESHSVLISGVLADSLTEYRLEYSSDVSQVVSELMHMQTVLLCLALSLSLVGALILYAVLARVFKPIDVVSQAAANIAGGRYRERIEIKGEDELSQMAENFNRMAEEIEKQVGLLEKEASQKQQFIDNFSHEIRTPLTSVYGYAEYIQKARLSKQELVESTQAIMNEAEYMVRISETLLELARLRQHTICEQEIDLQGFLGEITQSLLRLAPTPQAQRANITCECEAGTISGQEDLLRALIMNLGVNALKACPPEGGIVRLAARKEEGRVVLSVTDNGCGIPRESIARVTEPFYTADSSRSRESGGAGLGLALCKQIIFAHQAKMHIESREGEGTRVEVVFTTS